MAIAVLAKLNDLRLERETAAMTLERIRRETETWERVASGDIEVLRKMPLEVLGLPLRPYRALLSKGYESVGKVIDLNRNQMLRIEDMGPKAVEDVVKCLVDFGVNLKPTPVGATECE